MESDRSHILNFTVDQKRNTISLISGPGEFSRFRFFKMLIFIGSKESLRSRREAMDVQSKHSNFDLGLDARIQKFNKNEEEIKRSKVEMF